MKNDFFLFGMIVIGAITANFAFLHYRFDKFSEIVETALKEQRSKTGK